MKYSSGNSTAFRIDDVLMQGTILMDNDAPELLQINVLSDTELDLQFNEELEENIAETATNYNVAGIEFPLKINDQW